MTFPIDRMHATLSSQGVAKFLAHFEAMFPETHMKNLTVEAMGPGQREIEIDGRHVVNFGSDSFLGLDRDPRVHDALIRGIQKWGSHNGGSRAFTSVRSNVEAEDKIAEWLGTEASVIFPSVTLLNLGVIPGLVTKRDLIAIDEYGHNSMQEGCKIAKANGTRVITFKHNSIMDLERKLEEAKPYGQALICIDGVYSMGGDLPPLVELHEIALKHDGVLYVDDAHGTGVLGTKGRGMVRDILGHCENMFLVGSLSKAFSCFGGFIGCPEKYRKILKIRSNSYIFGGPVPPCYLDAICTVIDILQSDEYETLHDRLEANRTRLVNGATELGFRVLGGLTPIISLLMGDEETTLCAGRRLFEAGYYVQSVTFPAVPYKAAVLRIQVNSNHTLAEVDGLLQALADLGHVREPAIRVAA